MLYYINIFYIILYRCYNTGVLISP